MRRFRITVDGVAYEVSVEELDPAAEPTRLPSPPAATEPPPARTSRPAEPPPVAPGDIASPLAGVVVSVGVAPGERVEAGHPLLVLEAMKMQTTIPAPRSGTVASVVVGPGASVREGQLLLSLR